MQQWREFKLSQSPLCYVRLLCFVIFLKKKKENSSAKTTPSVDILQLATTSILALLHEN